MAKRFLREKNVCALISLRVGEYDNGANSNGVPGEAEGGGGRGSTSYPSLGENSVV